jgi:glycosyltransferase involved in cell wall biosynthesis
MKICLVNNLYPPIAQGGAEIYVGQLARALAEDHQVVVVTTEPGFHLAPRRETTAEGIVVYRLAPFFRAIDLYHPQIAAAMSAIMRRERPEVTHLHNWVGLSLAALLSGIPSSAPHIPVAMTLHDDSLLATHPVIRRLNRRLTSQIGLVISPSHYVLDQHLQQGFFRQATQQVLPYGLEPVSKPVGASPSPSGGGQGGGLKPTFDVLFMGRVQRYKGIDVLVQAFRALRDPSLRLHVAGSGPSLDACERLAQSDDRIRFYGLVSGERRRSLIENADCLVLPSLRPDNYGVGIQDAFQSGAVVIASRVGGIPEMIRDGVNGLLVEPGDEAGLGAAIERLRSSPDLAAKLRASALETSRLHDMRFHVAHLVDAYQRLLVTDRVRPFDRRVA